MTDSLPTELILNNFSYLDFKSLLQCQSVCKYWSALARNDTLWRRLCADTWFTGEELAAQQSQDDYMQIFQRQYMQYGRHADCYKAIRTAWHNVEQFIVEKHVRVQLRSGLSDAQLDELEHKMLGGTEIPNDLRCSWRLHDGDPLETIRERPLWKTQVGDDDFARIRRVESFVSLHASPTEDLLYMCQAGFCPFTVSYTFLEGDFLLSRNAKCVALHNNQLCLPYGTVVELPLYVTSLDGVREVRILARSYSEWLVRYAQELAADFYAVLQNQICGFRREPQLTRHLQISDNCSIQLRISLMHLPECRVITDIRNVMSFCVEMSMNADADTRNECKVETYNIQNYDNSGAVIRRSETSPTTFIGNAIIGPTCTFRYCNVALTCSESGKVTGHFMLRRLRGNVPVKVELPTIQFQLLPSVCVLPSHSAS